MATVPFTPAWLAGEDRARALLPMRFHDPGERGLAVQVAASRSVAPAVLESVRTVSDAQARNLDRLATGATCVVTGQQAGLFGGPLYTVYKAAAAIVDARALEAETGVPCVPVFWLQNEDHDFAEIAACHVLGPDHALHTLKVADDPALHGRSISERPVDAAPALDALSTLLPAGSPALAQLQRSYAPGRTLDQAFADWVHALFADQGLLVLDPSAPAIQEAARPLHRRAWAEAAGIGRVLQARSEALEAAGFRVQVHVRPTAPLSFVHPEGRSGPRYRVEPVSPGRMRLCGTEQEVATDAVSDGPFSTSALLRPILQDTLLPTVAYVGGPGEIAYFAQLPPLYEAFDVPMPLVVPRARFRVIDAACARVLGELGLAPDDLAADRDALLSRVATGDPALAPDALTASLLEPLQAVLDAHADAITALDPTLMRATARTRRSTERALRRLIDRVGRARGRRDTTTAARLDRVIAWLQPDGAPQERVHAWPWYGARYGVQGFVDDVVGAVRPFDGSLHDLPLEPVP